MIGGVGWGGRYRSLGQTQTQFFSSETEFKEFEQRIKFKPRLNYDWFNLKLYQMFQD